jgi:flagellar hook assembly protein FlgD
MDGNVIPTEFALAQNYPNPFNPSTSIQFDLPKTASVTLEIYNILGISIRSLIRDEAMNSGRYTAVWDGRDEGGRGVSSGVHVYRISAGDFHASKKMAFVR